MKDQALGTAPSHGCLKYSLDGGKTWQDAPMGVLVSHGPIEAPDPNDSDCTILVDVVVTHEGEGFRQDIVAIMDVPFSERPVLENCRNLASDVVDRLM